MSHVPVDALFTPLGIAVLTVSDTRGFDEDGSGDLLVEHLSESGHILVERRIVPDDIYQVRAVVSEWIARTDIQVILVNGGTGFTARDTTPEALIPLFDKAIEGYGGAVPPLLSEDHRHRDDPVSRRSGGGQPNDDVCDARLAQSVCVGVGQNNRFAAGLPHSALQLRRHGAAFQRPRAVDARQQRPLPMRWSAYELSLRRNSHARLVRAV